MEIEIIFNYGTVVVDMQIFEESKNSTISNCYYKNIIEIFTN